MVETPVQIVGPRDQIRVFRGTPRRECKLENCEGLHAAFLRFDSDPAPADGGLCLAMRQAIADALCANYYVTFLDTDSLKKSANNDWQAHDGYATYTCTDWFRKNYTLTWTRQADIARRALENYWTSEAQLIFLSASDKPIGFDLHRFDVDRKHRLSVLNDMTEFTGMLVPGVDGDFAGLYLRRADDMRRLLEVDLAIACKTHDVALAVAESANNFCE